MSTQHLGCCCPTDVPPLSCVDSCFATSYSLSGVEGTYYYEKTRPWVADESCACYGGTVREVYSEYFVTVSFSQNGTDTLTRSGAGQCCYEARGDLTVTASVRFIQYSWCCTSQEYTVNEQSFTRTEEAVPYCFTMQCITNETETCGRTIQGPDRWEMQLSICDFPLVESTDLVYEDSNPLDCPPSAILPTGLIVGGASFYAMAKLKAPDRIQFNEWADHHGSQAVNRCPISGDTIPEPPGACDPTQDSPTCMPSAVYNNSNHGNFAILMVDEFSPQDPPSYCSSDCGEIAIASVLDAFDGSGNTLLPCINVEDNWVAIPGTECTSGAIRSGGWNWEIG